MGLPRAHPDVALIVGMLSAFPQAFGRAEASLVERFGPVARRSDEVPFDFTDYYQPEMGRGIRRRFLSFARLIRPEALAEIKLWTNDLEQRLAAPDYPARRPINLDPGYVAPGKLVLATTKDYAHRIYLGQGIYAEITLVYRDGAFQPMPWTYPDYRVEAHRRFFETVRADLMAFHRAQRKKDNVALQED